MARKLKTALAIIAAAGLAAVSSAQPVRYEAGAGELDNSQIHSDLASVEQHADASGGEYVFMREGNISFTVNAPEAGFYTIWVRFSQTCDNTKQQNLLVNGSAAGVMTFPLTGTFDGPVCGPPVFDTMKGAGKVKLDAGANTVALTKSWGWVGIDYIEVEPYASEPFALSPDLVTPNASVNARKMYQFLRENFQRRIISGVMVGYALTSSWQVPHTLASLPETKHVFDNSGKYPALLGLDFFHGTAQGIDPASTGWFIDQNNAAIALAEEIFNEGGIPHLMWHWKNPSGVLGQGEGRDNAFYSNTTLSEKGKPDGTKFDIAKAFTDDSHTVWNTSSDEYKFMLNDIDTVAGYLKQLADKGVAVLWRPLHEAAGTWFWWGARGAQANKMLWILMFERMVRHHGLDNLIWVWTCEEYGPPQAWYPGDEYVDIIGRDYYEWPDADNKQVYGSLVSNFENLKEIYAAKKIIGLSEQGTVPDPDSLIADGAGWSFFMSWNEQFLRRANPNAHWNRVMNHDYVITLGDMPGWNDYDLTSIRAPQSARRTAAGRAAAVSVRGGTLNVSSPVNAGMRVKLIDVRGKVRASFNAQGRGSFSLAKIPAGRYFVEVRGSGVVQTTAVIVK